MQAASLARRAMACAALAVGSVAPLSAQATSHPAGGHAPASAMPTEVGQSAFAALAEVVRLLSADPRTDWSTVDLEALRQHLRDMDLVLLQARVAQAPVDGGIRMEVTGDGEVTAAIRRMLHSHAQALEAELPVAARVEHHALGLVLTATARQPTDSALVTRLRRLGFAGLLVTGNHHAPHHLRIARGEHAAHGAHMKH